MQTYIDQITSTLSSQFLKLEFDEVLPQVANLRPKLRRKVLEDIGSSHMWWGKPAVGMQYYRAIGEEEKGKKTAQGVFDHETQTLGASFDFLKLIDLNEGAELGINKQVFYDILISKLRQEQHSLPMMVEDNYPDQKTIDRVLRYTHKSISPRDFIDIFAGISPRKIESRMPTRDDMVRSHTKNLDTIVYLLTRLETPDSDPRDYTANYHGGLHDLVIKPSVAVYVDRLVDYGLISYAQAFCRGIGSILTEEQFDRGFQNLKEQSKRDVYKTQDIIAAARDIAMWMSYMVFKNRDISQDDLVGLAFIFDPIIDESNITEAYLDMQGGDRDLAQFDNNRRPYISFAESDKAFDRIVKDIAKNGAGAAKNDVAKRITTGTQRYVNYVHPAKSETIPYLEKCKQYLEALIPERAQDEFAKITESFLEAKALNAVDPEYKDVIKNLHHLYGEAGWDAPAALKTLDLQRRVIEKEKGAFTRYKAMFDAGQVPDKYKISPYDLARLPLLKLEEQKAPAESA